MRAFDDNEIFDDELMHEIAMLTDLILATTRAHRPLTQAEVDEVLGVVPSGAIETRPQARGPG